MKTNFFKVSSALTVAMFIMVIFMGNAFGFGLKDLTGGKKKGKVGVDSLVDKQTDLVKRLYTALRDINDAQQHFANALGNKKQYDIAVKLAKSLADPNAKSTEAINEDVSSTTKLAADQQTQLKEAQEYDGPKKQELQKGLIPYSTGTVHSVLLGKEFMDHLNSTKDAIKQAGITKAHSVKRKLDVTLHVGPNIPKLGSSLLATANTAIEVAKKEKLKGVKESKKILEDAEPE